MIKQMIEFLEVVLCAVVFGGMWYFADETARAILYGLTTFFAYGALINSKRTTK